MRRRTKRILKIVIGIVAALAVIVAVILWCVGKGEQPTQNETTPTPTVAAESVEPGTVRTEGITLTVAPTEEIKPENEPTNVPVVEPTKEVEPTDAPEEIVTPTDAPVITNPASPTPVEVGPTTMPEVTETPSVTEVPEIEPTTVPEPTKAPTVAPSATPTPTKAPTATPTPTPLPTMAPKETLTPTPAPQREYVSEYQMGDNVWYRLTEDGTLYVTGTGATVRFDYTYDKATDRIYGGDYHYDNMAKSRKAKHIVIEEGITKLSSWSLMHLPDVESIIFPKSLQEIEDYCFMGTGKTVNVVWIGLDKDKVKLGADAFYGTVYQTEEDLRKPTPIPTSTPTPTSTPMKATDFYRALVEEAGIKIDKNDKEPYSAALVREGIIKETELLGERQKIFNREVARILYNAAQIFGCESNEEVVAAAKKYDRISDKTGIYPKFEDGIYYCFGNGIMPGVSDGEYSHTRDFKPEEPVREADARLYCKRLFHPGERVPMSPDAQVIRTTNLPVQAKLYPYILESFPNVYYDTNYLYMYNLGTDDRAFPDAARMTRFLETWCTPNTVEEFSKNQPERCYLFTSEWDYLGYEKVGMDKVVERYRDTWEQQAREYLELVFNFDYRTVREDTEWQEKIKNLNAFYHEWGKGVYEGSCAGIKRIDEWFAGFLDNAEKYHTVVECDEIDFDMSTLFYSERFDDSAPYTMRVHLRYKITTDAEPGLYERAEIVPVRAYGVIDSFTTFNEWKDVYAELTFATNSFDRTGIGGVRIIEYNVDDAIRYHFDPKQYVK